MRVTQSTDQKGLSERAQVNGRSDHGRGSHANRGVSVAETGGDHMYGDASQQQCFHMKVAKVVQPGMSSGSLLDGNMRGRLVAPSGAYRADSARAPRCQPSRDPRPHARS
jgi:hypothetical protein